MLRKDVREMKLRNLERNFCTRPTCVCELSQMHEFWLYQGSSYNRARIPW